MIAESRPPQYPDKYPGAEFKFSMPVEEDPFFSGETLLPLDRFGLHVIYQGRDGRFFEDVTLMGADQNTAAEVGRNRDLTRADYDETLAAYDIPTPTGEPREEEILWVANRRESVIVESFTGNPATRQRKITLRRQKEAPHPLPFTPVETGVDMVGELVEKHGFDPYDLTFLTGGTRDTVKPTNLLDRLGAIMTDKAEHGAPLPNRYPKRVMRAVVLNSR